MAYTEMDCTVFEGVKRRILTQKEINDLFRSKMEDYNDILASLRGTFSSLEDRDLKNKVQELSLNLLSDLTKVTEWKFTLPGFYSKSLDDFINYINSARWLLSLFNSTQNIYG